MRLADASHPPHSQPCALSGPPPASRHSTPREPVIPACTSRHPEPPQRQRTTSGVTLDLPQTHLAAHQQGVGRPSVSRMRPVPPSPHAHPPPRGLPATWIPGSRWNDRGGAGIQTCAAAHSAAQPRIGLTAHASRPAPTPGPPPHCVACRPPGSPSFQRRLESRRARQRTPRRSRASGPPMRPVPPSPHAPPHRVACRPPGFQPSLE